MIFSEVNLPGNRVRETQTPASQTSHSFHLVTTFQVTYMFLRGNVRIWASTISFPGLEETILLSKEHLLSSYTFVKLCLLTIYVMPFLGFCMGLVPGPPQIPKSMDTQVPYIKWHSICIQPMHILQYTLNNL